MTDNTFPKYAIFAVGSKQYQAIPNKTIAIEKMDVEIGSTVEFKDVLLRKTGEDTFEFGTPTLNTPLTATIVKHIKEPKVIIFKFQRRKKTRVKKGHRQAKTIVRFSDF